MDHDHHDRWLISYADLITLLFAFFVVMYAVSAVNENKYRVLAHSLGDAFGKSGSIPGERAQIRTLARATQVPQRAPKQPPAIAEQAHMTEVANSLLEAMAPLVKEGKVRMTRSRRGISIEINANVLFDPGRAELHAQSLNVLSAVAAKLKNEPFNLEIIGHTDGVPISNSVFASNWELSSVRAASVVRLLADQGIAPARLYAIGREASQPIATNDSADGRARNRRVEIMILSGEDVIEEIPVTPQAEKNRRPSLSSFPAI